MEIRWKYRYIIRPNPHDVIHVYYDLAICSYSLSGNIRDWLNEYLKDRWNFSHTTDEFFIDFERESDLNWFKLRWE